MELKFLGRGGAFFTEEGNTAAYFIEDKTLFFIDCGETVFSKIIQLDLLKRNHIEKVYCFVTHMHGDHVGSLSSLIYYCHYIDINNPIAFRLVCPDILKDELFPMLKSQGCIDFFNFNSPDSLSGKFRSFDRVRFIQTTHQQNIPAFCIEFETSNGKIFYSGDTNNLELIQSYVDQGMAIERMYVEATTLDYPGNAHLPLRKLDKIIPKEFRNKVYLMHFNNSECIAKAQELGFQVVKCVK